MIVGWLLSKWLRALAYYINMTAATKAGAEEVLVLDIFRAGPHTSTAVPGPSRVRRDELWTETRVRLFDLVT